MAKHNSDFITAFRKAISDIGLIPPETIIADGKVHRFASNGEEGDSAGWYVFRNGKIPTGKFGCWRLGKSLPWQADIGKPLTAKQQAELKAELEALSEVEAKEKAQRNAAAGKKALAIIESAELAISHPYLERKQVDAYGIYECKDALVIPMRDAAGNLHSLQFIDVDGCKQFLSGGRIKGCYHLIGTPADIICVAEGYATGATIHKATKHAVAVAFNANNLSPVTQTVRKQYPNARIVVCADDDWCTEGNPGITKASEAAHATHAVVAMPEFGASRGSKDTDFNDMACAAGDKAVKAVIEKAIRTGVANVTDVISNKVGGLDVTATDTSASTNVADDAREMWVPIDQRPCFKVLDTDTIAAGRSFKAGVWRFGIKMRNGEVFPVDSWICSPLHVEAVTHDVQANNFGRLLRFHNSLGKWREWAMPMEMLRGSGEELRGELLSMGVHLSPADNKLLAEYLQWHTPKKIMHCALQVGWCGDSFVLPDVVIGKNASAVIFQSGERGHEEHTQAGTLEGWKECVAARAVGNPLLTLAVSAAFAGPLLQKCNAESGGLHMVGNSSTGKTTAIEAACSVWGGHNFHRSWRTTSNGMEGVAALFNDCLLALDEISECDPREVGAIVYALGNGRGKQRASRTGSARSITRWRCSVLSSGERSIATTMADGGYRIKAGQAVRLLDIPAMRAHGAWDNLHGFNNGAAFSDAIRNAVVSHHGKAGRAFLEELTHDTQNFCERLEQIKSLSAFSGETGQGQDKRVAARFALIGMAGEIATEYGLTGWPAGDAIKAAIEGLRAWRSLRGGSGNDEKQKIPEQILEFIEKHGDSRFSTASGEYGTTQIRDRAGWWEDKENERLYYFTSAGLREATKGHDLKPVLDTLQEIGALPPAGSNGERASPKRFGGRQVKVYTIKPEKLAVITATIDGVAADVTANQQETEANTSVTDATPIAAKGKHHKFTRQQNKGGKK